MQDFPPFEIDKKRGSLIWMQLYQRFVYLIVSGYYKPGDKLPTVRKLAIELDISYHTVNRVYLELEKKEFVTLQCGKGTHVAEPNERNGLLLLSNKNNQIIAEYTDTLLSAGLTAEEIVQSTANYLGVRLSGEPSTDASNRMRKGEKDVNANA